MEVKKTIVPIYLKNVSYQQTFLAQIKGLPANDQFIADTPNKDAAFAAIVEVVQRIIASII